MKRSCYWVLISLFLLTVSLACGKTSSNNEGDAEVQEGDTPAEQELEQAEPEYTEGEQPPINSVRATIEQEPLALDLSFEDKPLTRIGVDGRYGFYLVDKYSLERVELTGAPSSSEEGGVTTLVYDTEDDRQVTVTLEPVAEEGLRVRVTASELVTNERIGAIFTVGAKEGFYGLMERVVQGAQDHSWEPGMTEGLDLRGQEVELYIRYTVSLYAPFFVSSAGWGLYAESDHYGTYRFGVDEFRQDAPTELSIEYDGEELAFRVFPGPKPLQATERFARTVGTTIVPPRWGFGPWRWRDEVWDLPAFYDGTPYDGPYNSMIVEDILMMEALDIPCTLYWVDRPWSPGDFGYDDLAWDEQRLPDPLDMLAWLKGKGVESGLRPPARFHQP